MTARAGLLSLLLVACSSTGTLEIRILTPTGQDPFASAVTARLTVGTAPPVVREFPITQGDISGDIPNAPTEVSATLMVELLDPRGDVVARGRTPPVPLSGGLTGFVEVLVSRVGAFANLPGGMGTGTRGHGAAVISAYEVLIVGGLDRSGAPVARGEVYNLYAHGSATIANLVTPRARPAVIPLGREEAWIYGGEVASASGLVPTATAELFDLVNLTFTGVQGAGEARAAPTATPISDTSAVWLLAGGDGAAGAPVASALLFDASTGSLTAVAGPMQAARHGHTATLVQTTTGPRILLFGGAADGPEAELFDPATSTFAPLEAPGRRREHGAAKLPDGRVLLSGGRDPAGTPLADLLLYDPQCDGVRCPAFSAPELALVDARYGHATHGLGGNRVLVAAGRGAGDAPLQSAEVLVYDAAHAPSFTREDRPLLASPRAEFSSVELPTGEIGFFGGVDASGVPLSSAELFNPK